MKKCTLLLSIAVFAAAFMILVPGRALAQGTGSVQAGMRLLKSKAAALGTPSIRGEAQVAGKTVPVLYFGTTRMNNNFALVDEVQKRDGGTATIFVKSGDEFVRVATNVRKTDGSRAVGTVLDPHGKVIGVIRKGKNYFGEANILGKAYNTGYEPIRDAGNNIIGIYYVGYLKK